jgi:tRNA(Ile)-lysidine synthase
MTAFNGFRIRASLLKNRRGFDPAQASSSQAFFDRAMLEGRAITVGGRRPGETMVPFGSSLPKRTKELFIDAKVTREERARWPVVRWGLDVLWLPGIRRSNLAPVDARTREIIKLELE